LRPSVSALAVLLAPALHDQAIAQDAAVPGPGDERADARIVGSVTDSGTGRPVPNATIQLRTRDGRDLASAQTAEDGRFSFFNLADGLFELTVSAEGYRGAIEPSLRVIANKASTIAFELEEEAAAVAEQLVVRARPLSNRQSGSVGVTTLGREEIRRAPGTAGDIFRGLNTLPGVVATGEFSNFSVRGRGPRDNLILIEDIPYDRTVHFDQSIGAADEVGGGGRFSIFGQNVIGRAEFQPGGWQAAYAGASGALLRLELSEGNADTAFNSVKVDLAGAEYLYDGPLLKSQNTTALFSARYFNFGPLFDLIDERDIGTPELVDVLIKTKTELGPRTTLSFLAVYTPEWFERDAENVVASPNLRDVATLRTSQQAGVVGATLENFIGVTGRLKNIVYVRAADDESALGEAVPELSLAPITAQSLFVEDNIIRLREKELEIGWRLDYSQRNALGSFSAGSRVVYLQTDYQQSVARDFAQFDFNAGDLPPGSTQNFVLLTPDDFNNTLDESALRVAGYIDQTFDLGRLSVRPGLRIDYDGLLRDVYVSPRVQANFAINSATRLTATGGLYFQSPRVIEVAANAENISLLSPQRTLQFSLGLERFFGENYRMLIEGYYQDLDDQLTERNIATGLLTSNGDGRTFGVDWLLSKRFSRQWSGTVRYSYVDAELNDNDGLGAFDADFSRPHLGNVTVAYEPSKKWAFSAQYQIASGRPTDSFLINEDVFGDPGFLRFSRERLVRNADRLPSFQSLNVRADYRQRIAGANLIAFIDVINAFGRENVSVLGFSQITGEVISDGLTVFPQFGLTLEF